MTVAFRVIPCLDVTDGRVVKARELSGGSDLLFLRDSQSGAVIVKSRSGRQVELNAALHSN